MDVSVPFRGFVIHNIKVEFTKKDNVMVSVPFRGFVIHNELIKESFLMMTQKWFPSPFGVLSFITIIMEIKYMALVAFPSPFGVLSFITR